MASFEQVMASRLAALRAHPPTVEHFRPELTAAATQATRQAAIRRSPVKTHLSVGQTEAKLTFTGPGAAHADSQARKLLSRTVPEAVERARADIVRRLKG